MALTEENGGMVMPVGPMYGGNNGGFGDFGGNSGWWIILLFILLGNRGWNGNYGDGGNGVQAGFNQAALTSALSSLQNSVTSGFGDVQNALCNGFNQAEVAANSRQMADMQQMFSLQQQLSTCCCNQQAATESLRATILAENCADRQAVADGVQRILDQMCNDKIDAKNEKIAELQNQLTMANLAASQGQQTAQILADNARQTVALEQYLNPTPVPAYVVQNPNCCSQNYGCGCNFAA